MIYTPHSKMCGVRKSKMIVYTLCFKVCGVYELKMVMYTLHYSKQEGVGDRNDDVYPAFQKQEGVCEKNDDIYPAHQIKQEFTGCRSDKRTYLPIT